MHAFAVTGVRFFMGARGQPYNQIHMGFKDNEIIFSRGRGEDSQAPLLIKSHVHKNIKRRRDLIFVNAIGF